MQADQDARPLDSPDQDPLNHEQSSRASDADTAFDLPRIDEELCTSFVDTQVTTIPADTTQAQSKVTTEDTNSVEAPSPWNLNHIVANITSPALFGGAGMVLVSAPYSRWTASAYALTTVVSVYNDFRTSPDQVTDDHEKHQHADSIISRMIRSPGLIYGVGAAVAMAQSTALVAQGELLSGFAYGCVTAGSIALASLVNRQEGYTVFDNEDSLIGRSLSAVNNLLPSCASGFLTNPVVSLATANMLFSATTPGAMSEVSQTVALGFGVGFGVFGIIRAALPDQAALKQSLILGAVANVSLALNAGLGESLLTAGALALWSIQNISAYWRER